MLPLILGWLIGASTSPAFCATAEQTPAFRPRTGTFQLLESSAAHKDPVVFVWETSDHPDWFKPYQGADAAYQDFAKWVRAQVDPEPRALLSRNRDIAKKKGWSTRRYDLILSGRLGSIRPINRLEAEILLLQLDRFGKPYEGEILAFVLRKAGRLRIYGYATATQTMKPGVLRRRLEGDIADHWRFYANLHNHPFLFSDKNATSGELFPSGDTTDGDVQYYLADAENLALQRAWITNGFDTIEIAAKEFPTLEAIPDR
ncbi:MAG: hypothetical protein NTY77_07495 [Elusimicrobia bacterium]|nr:hypothetical protein [Elusimicrobiota bacterium]